MKYIFGHKGKGTPKKRQQNIQILPTASPKQGLSYVATYVCIFDRIILKKPMPV